MPMPLLSPSRRRQPTSLWARVGVDGMDVPTLARTVREQARRHPAPTIAAGVAVAAITAADVFVVVRSTRRRSIEATASTTVAADPARTYEFWRHLTRLPDFMQHVEEVTVDGPRSHWRVSAPSVRTVEWDAELVADRAGERLSWRTTDDADVQHEGTVEFRPAPGGRGTEVRVRVRYDMPGGRVGEAVSRALGEDPHQQLDDDLRRMKQVIETGEVVRSDGAPEGKRARHEFPQHAAQPLSEAELEEVGV